MHRDYNYTQEQPSSQLIGHSLSPEEPCPPRIKASTVLIVWLSHIISPGPGEGGVALDAQGHGTHQLNQ